MYRFAALVALAGMMIAPMPAGADNGDGYVCWSHTATGQYMCRAWGGGGGQVMAYVDGDWVLLYTWVY